MDTWGISGPRFLLIYVALLAVTVAGVVLARRRALAAPDGAAVPARLDRYEAAYLNGGCDLAATTAISALLRARHLAPSPRRRSRGRLVAGTAPPAGAHPVEWATYQLVATRPDHPQPALGAELCREPAMAAVRERQRRLGLAPTDEQRARYRATGLWFLPVAALGVARVAAGTANGRPVGFLVVLLAVTVVLAVVLCLRVPNATGLGRRTLERLRAETGRPAAGASASELALWPPPCSAPGSCGPPTPRRPWPCASPASTAPTWAAPGAATPAAAEAAVAAGAAGAAVAGGVADEPAPRGRHRLAGRARRVRGPSPGAGVRGGGGRAVP